MNEKIKPCPFCGVNLMSFGHDIISGKKVEIFMHHDVSYLPSGDRCPINGLVFTASQFNTRPLEVNLQEEIDRQREINKTIARDVQKGTEDGYRLSRDRYIHTIDELNDEIKELKTAILTLCTVLKDLDAEWSPGPLFRARFPELCDKIDKIYGD